MKLINFCWCQWLVFIQYRQIEGGFVPFQAIDLICRWLSVLKDRPKCSTWQFSFPSFTKKKKSKKQKHCPGAVWEPYVCREGGCRTAGNRYLHLCKKCKYRHGPSSVSTEETLFHISFMVYSPSMHLIHWSRRSFTIFHVDCFLRQWNFFSPDSNNISKCKVYFKLEKRTVLICSHVRTDCLLGVLTPAWRNNDRCFDKIRSARVHNTQLAHMYMHWRDKVTGKDWNYISFVSVLGGRTTQAYLRTAFCKKKPTIWTDMYHSTEYMYDNLQQRWWP